MKAIAGILIVFGILGFVAWHTHVHPIAQVPQVTSSDPSTQIMQLQAQQLAQHNALGAR